MPATEQENKVFDEIYRELQHALIKYKSFNSPHEGYAVILEELDELWELVKKNGRRGEMQTEAKHVAAMAMRFITDLCTK